MDKKELINIILDMSDEQISDISNYIIKAQEGTKLPSFNKDDIVNLVKSSKANWVQRLLNGNIKTIPTWENPKTSVSTHKLGYATGEGNKVFVYPSIQEIDGELHDFTDPVHKHGEWDSFDSAMKNGDYVEFPNEESAKWFTENYKDYFDSTKKFADKKEQGGVLSLNGKDINYQEVEMEDFFNEENND